MNFSEALELIKHCGVWSPMMGDVLAEDWEVIE